MCVEKKLQAIVMVSKVDTGNKVVRSLTGLIPLQSKISQYANVYVPTRQESQRRRPTTYI